MNRKLYLRIAIVATLLFKAALGIGKNIIVVNEVDRQPLEGVTIFSKTGHIVGQTDSAGCLAVSSLDFPVRAGCVGFVKSRPQAEADTLLLTPRITEMQPVEVDAAGRPITHIILYAREYYTGAAATDTLLTQAEYVADLFLAPKGTKGYKSSDAAPRICKSRKTSRIASAEQTEANHNVEDFDMEGAFFKMLVNIPSTIEIPETMKGGATTAMIGGKYGPAMMLHRDSNLLYVKADPLSEYKNHTFSPWFLKLLGMTTEVNRFDVRLNFLLPAEGVEYSPSQFVEGSFSTTMLGRGKWIKKVFHSQEDVLLECMVQAWPIEVQHLTLEEYKELREAAPELDFPATLPGE